MVKVKDLYDLFLIKEDGIDTTGFKEDIYTQKQLGPFSPLKSCQNPNWQDRFNRHPSEHLPNGFLLPNMNTRSFPTVNFITTQKGDVMEKCGFPLSKPIKRPYELSNIYYEVILHEMYFVQKVFMVFGGFCAKLNLLCSCKCLHRLQCKN